jgi:rubredoxin
MVFNWLRRLGRPDPRPTRTAPRCPDCGQPLLWRKARLFEQPDEAEAAARARFEDIRGVWYCPRCSEEPG